MIATRIDRRAEVGNHLGGAEQRTDLQPPRQQRGVAEHQPRDGRRGDHGGQDTKFGLLQGGPGERESRDQDGHGEADTGDRADAGDGGPADRRPQPATAETGQQPGPARDAQRLPRDVTDEDAQGDRGGVGAGEEGAAEGDAGVGQGE